MRMRERFTMTGDLGAATLPAWVRRHARRLGLEAEITLAEPARMVLDLAGPPELLDAMEMGCLLGPIEVWVDSIRRDSLNS